MVARFPEIRLVWPASSAFLHLLNWDIIDRVSLRADECHSQEGRGRSFLRLEATEYSDKFNGIRTSRQFYLLLWELVRDSGVNRKTIGTALSRVCWNDLDSEFVKLANLAGASTIDISSYRWTAESNAFKKGFSDFVFQWFKGFQGKEHGCTLERRWFLYYYVSLFDKKILRSHRIPILNPSFGHTFGFLSL